MTPGVQCFSLICLIIAVLSRPGDAFQVAPKQKTCSPVVSWIRQHAVAQDDISVGHNVVENGTKPCFYRSPEGRWKPRLNFLDLTVGQALNGTVVQELLDAKSGPKLFFECGVGRIDSKGEWQIVNGMLRFLKKGVKKSVVRKKALKLKKKSPVELYVSRIFADSCQFEVCTALEEGEDYQKKWKKMVSASSLKPQQEVVGTVNRITPYGVFVDVGANRDGLLHISKVADLYGRYIDKEEGLEEAGLERGARIRVAVLSNERKRLALDFTQDVKEEAEKEKNEREKRKLNMTENENVQEEQEEPEAVTAELDPYDISDEEAAMWAASEAEADYGDDEDRDIEDALGLGAY